MWAKTRSWLLIWEKKRRKTHTPVYISGIEVEQVNSFRFLGINIKENLSRTPHISTRESQKQLYFLRKLKKGKFPCQVLVSFYSEAIVSILTRNFTWWHWFSMAKDRLCMLCNGWLKLLGSALVGLSSYWDYIHHSRCLCRTKRMVKESAPSTSLLTLLPSGKRYRGICCTTI